MKSTHILVGGWIHSYQHNNAVYFWFIDCNFIVWVGSARARVPNAHTCVVGLRGGGGQHVKRVLRVWKDQKGQTNGMDDI